MEVQKFKQGDQGELAVIGTFLLVVEEILAMGKSPGCTTGPLVAQSILATRIDDELYQVLEDEPGRFKVVLPGPRTRS